MRIGHVIGRVTMNQQEAAFKGGRWLLVNPIDAGQMNKACDRPPALTKHFTAGLHDIVGFVEGAEATAPFDDPTPIDAITVAIFDEIHHTPHQH